MGRIGIIGLGATGSAVARRLLEREFEVTVHDGDARTVAALRDVGAGAARSPAEAAEAADLVFVHLPHERAVEDVSFGRGGIAAAMPAGGFVVLGSAAVPASVLSAAARLASVGVHTVEAWFLGDGRSTPATVLGGGGADHLETIAPVLGAIAVDRARVGPLGSVAALRTALAAVRPGVPLEAARPVWACAAPPAAGAPVPALAQPLVP